MIDRICQVVDEFDNELGKMIGWCRLASEEEGPRHYLKVRVLPQPVVQHNDAKGVQQLPFVLVDALHLAIEDRVWIHSHSGARLDPSREVRFGITLGFQDGTAKAAIVGERSEHR